MTIFYSQKDIFVTALCKPHKSCVIKGILFYFLEWNWEMRKWKIHTKFKKSTFTIKFNKIPFKSTGIWHMPFPVLLKSTDTSPATLYPRSLCGGLKRWEKKRRDRNFDPIPVLSGAIPTVLKMLG